MRLPAALLILLALLCAPAAAEPSLGVNPRSFKAYDCPNDDGGGILVVWKSPDNQPKGREFAVEIAAREADFAADNNVKTVAVTHSPESLVSGATQYFGHTTDGSLCYALVTPSDLFPISKTENPTPDRLRKLAAENLINDAQLKRALAAEDCAEKSDKELTPLERADRKWFGSFQAYLAKKDNNVITNAQFARLLGVLERAGTPDDKLAPEALADRRWSEHLQSYFKKKDAEDAKNAKQAINARTYCFRLAEVENGKKSYISRDGKPVVLSATAEPNWFKWEKLSNLIFGLVFSSIVLVFIQVAKRRPNMFIRKIAGLDAVDEAIGRSTEMNRPVFFVHGGSSDVGGIATIASLNILAKVARKTAEYDSRVRVMNNDPIVTAVSQEVVQEAYTAAGRPESYNADDVSLVASEQFSYVAAVSGNMIREKPGAIFLMGSFFAEALLLAETGASTGAIQVAGTDEYTQLPFFITTCDYTLIGEELYAASAYLSRNPQQLGSLRGQDVGKAFMMIAIVVSVLVLTAAAAIPEASRWHIDLWWLRDIFRAY